MNECAVYKGLKEILSTEVKKIKKNSHTSKEALKKEIPAMKNTEIYSELD
jgi:hypothetical protein